LLKFIKCKITNKISHNLPSQSSALLFHLISVPHQSRPNTGLFISAPGHISTWPYPGWWWCYVKFPPRSNCYPGLTRQKFRLQCHGYSVLFVMVT